MNKHHLKNNAGMALLTALIFISVAVMMLGTLLRRNISQSNLTELFGNHTEILYAVEAGLAESQMELEAREDGILGLEGFEPIFSETNELEKWPDLESDVYDVQTSLTNPGLTFGSYAIEWFGDGRDSNGDGEIDSEAERDMYTIYALASLQGVTRRVEAVYHGGDINVWRNAIFAGAGAAGGLINGNVSIHGSVHLIGDELPEGELAIAAIELSGTSLIHNNYEGLDPDLAARVPALKLSHVEGEFVEDLEATLRIKNGMAGLSGSSEIGQPQETGNGFKERMKGTFVSDGWTGTAVTDDGDRGDPGSVWSDNGWDERYDVGSRVPFPGLSRDWREPVTGEPIPNPATGANYTHEEYFSEVLLADPVIKTDGIYVGDIKLAVDGDSFYWNATTDVTLTGAAAEAATPAATDDYFLFDTSNGNEADMIMNGQIRIDGNLSFTGQGNRRTVNYSGKAAILVYGDIEIDVNLLTCNNGDRNDTNNSFPENNVMGLMASNNMYVGTSAQLQIMGAFYAENMIRTSKQSDIVGTFVSNYFDMGTNVPSIFQVPDLADNLPAGMIGNYPIWALALESWREM